MAQYFLGAKMLDKLPAEVLREIFSIVVKKGYKNGLPYTSKYISDQYLIVLYQNKSLVAKCVPSGDLAKYHLRYLNLINVIHRPIKLIEFKNLSAVSVEISHASHWKVLESLPNSLSSLTLNILTSHYTKNLTELNISEIPLERLIIQSSKVVQKRLQNLFQDGRHLPGMGHFYHLVYHNFQTLGHVLFKIVNHFKSSLLLIQVTNIDLYLMFEGCNGITFPKLKLLMFDNCSLTNLNKWLQMINQSNPRTSNPLFYTIVDYLERRILSSTSSNSGNWSTLGFEEGEINRIKSNLGV